MSKKELKDNVISQEMIQGRKVWFKRIIKSNRTLYGFLYKFFRCNRYVFILRNFWKDTDGLFNHISIETCAICNRKCSFCPISEDVTPRGMMSNELFDKIVKELKKLHYRGSIALSNYGEPLLDKRLAKFAEKIKEQLGSKIIINTNGDFLTKERFRELISAGVDMFCVSQHNSEPSAAIKNLFSKITPAERKNHISYIIVKEDSIGLINQGGLVKVNSIYPFLCRLQCMIIRADGSVPFCCCDYYNKVNFGNANQCKLIDIWNNSSYKKIRAEIKRGIFNLEICKKCRGILP